METVNQCLGRSVYLLNSGPAAAPAAANYVGAGSNNVISVDMGGTSFDVCLLIEGQIPTSDAAWVGDHRVAIRMVDVKSIGAGGGGVAWVDSLGLLRVGPQSAGSDPGPACFGKGEEPTVTDADLLLGYMPADYFRGGKESLSVEAASIAMQRVAEPLGIDTDEAAQAVVSTVNAAMADLITEVCTRRGLDVRDFEMVAGGGAGPVHAAFIADLAGIQRVMVPTMAPLLSAFGMFTMDLGRDYARSYFAPAEMVDANRVAFLYQEMEDEAKQAASQMGIQLESLRFTRTAELRYFGQFHEVETPVPAGPITTATLKSTVRSFHREHHSLFNFSMPWLEVQFLTFRLLATAAPMSFSLPSIPNNGTEPQPERTRRCRWAAGWSSTPVFRSGRLGPGHEIRGPGIIEERLTTVVIPEGWCARVDEHRNYRLTRESFVTAEEATGSMPHA
jgi:N-methylhydantoinase A